MPKAVLLPLNDWNNIKTAGAAGGLKADFTRSLASTTEIRQVAGESGMMMRWRFYDHEQEEFLKVMDFLNKHGVGKFASVVE